jgi:ABC-type nitrate/sulfonate/bicarbonate transport system permease component
MQKNSTFKTLIIFTLIFVFIALASFAAFRETEQVSAQVGSCLKASPACQGSEMLWEMVSRQFLSFLTI